MNRIKSFYAGAKKFWRENTRGGVTVFICLILIPVMMFTGVLIDLARVKLSYSEAVSAADAYADAMLSQYDELLYDIYGFLSITQDEKALGAVEAVREQIASVYDPAGSPLAKNIHASNNENVQWAQDSIANILSGSGLPGDYTRLYGNTKMKLDAVVSSQEDGYTLSNPVIFGEQVSDYMKVIGPADLVLSGVLDAFSNSGKIAGDSELIEKRQKLDKKYQELDEKLDPCYDELRHVVNDERKCKFGDWLPYSDSGPNAIAEKYDSIAEAMLDHNEGFPKLFEYIDDFLSDYRQAVINGSKSEQKEIYDFLFVGSDAYVKHIEEMIERCRRGGNISRDTQEMTLGSVLQEALDGRSISKMIRDDTGEAEAYFIDSMKGINERVNHLESLAYYLSQSNRGSLKTTAEEAENLRGSLLDSCDRSINEGTATEEMARGLQSEYSFNEEEMENSAGDMIFLGDFNFEWLGDRYSNNAVYANEYRNYLKRYREDYKKNQGGYNEYFEKILSHAEELISSYKSKFDALRDCDDPENLPAVSSEKSEHFGFDRFKDKDSVVEEGSFELLLAPRDYIHRYIPREYESDEPPEEYTWDQLWFDIEVSGFQGRYNVPHGEYLDEKWNDTDKNYIKFYQILYGWYDDDATRSKEGEESITRKYKDFFGNVKKNLGDDEVWEEILKSVEGMEMPDWENMDYTPGKSKESSVGSLFGEDGITSVGSAADDDSFNGPGRDLNYYLTKLLMMDYDFNFFSWATYDRGQTDEAGTLGVLTDDTFEKLPRTLRFQEFDDSSNYTLRAELEYIYCGSKSAETNLKNVRNQLMLIRAVSNFASTYTITEINSAINSIRGILMPISRIAAIVVPPLVRATIAMAETGADMEKLYRGGDVVFIKTQISHMSILDNDLLRSQISDVLNTDPRAEVTAANAGGVDGSSVDIPQKGTGGVSLKKPSGTAISLSKDDKKIDLSKEKPKVSLEKSPEPAAPSEGTDTAGYVKFGYKEYLLVLMFMFTNTNKITERTQNLIEVNMNLQDGMSREKIKSSAAPEWTLDDTSLVVSSTCTVENMKLLMMGGVFKHHAIGGYASDDDLQIMENGFRYTVNRSY